jgi:hypothetical protein
MVDDVSVPFRICDYHTGLSAVRALLGEMKGLYRRLDTRLAGLGTEAGCAACGACCDFEAFGHRLYVTTPELLYFAHTVDRPLRPMSGGVCPYRVDGRCSVYSMRFAGCRIFQCKGNAATQSEMTEAALSELKRLCNEHKVPYYYMDLKAALDVLDP